METITQNWIARSSIRIHASTDKVWDALVNPEKIRKFMFGAEVESDFEEGSPIIWRGTWEGKSFEDRGQIVRVVPGKLLVYTHESGDNQNEENSHTVTVELKHDLGGVNLNLVQDNNASEEEKDKSERNWNLMLQQLKDLVED